MHEHIVIRGAKVHNLKNIDLTLPRDQLIVFTGLSGSGKSSLAFDTIYAVGQRRYVESLSAYARQFLGQMDKPDVDHIEGLSPAISIDQKTTSKNPRSTVGTITEIYDYLRLLYAHIGIPHCPVCQKVIERQSAQQIVDQIMELKSGAKLQVLAPVVRGRKGEYLKLIEDIKTQGFVRVRVDGSFYEVDEKIPLDKNKKHTIEIVVDRLVLKPDIVKRLTDSVETALKQASGLLTILADEEEINYSEHFACVDGHVSLEEMSPRMFSFNNPFGACQDCKGLGVKREFDPKKLIPNQDLSLYEGAIEPWKNQMDGFRGQGLDAVAKHFRFSMDVPYKKLKPEHQKVILYGTTERIKFSYEARSSDAEYHFQGKWEGLIPQMDRIYMETQSDYRRAEMDKYVTVKSCPSCQGEKLNAISRSVLVYKKSITDVTRMAIDECHDFFTNLKLNKREEIIAKQILKEILARLKFMLDVGLNYLSLDRSSGTLSGGESQRIRLATQIGSGLVGVLYVLDEPSIGLHQRDNERLIATLQRLKSLGNTLIVVEHDEDTIREADYVVDIGPGAGKNGGEIVAQGTLSEFLKNKKSLTAKFIIGEEKIEVPTKRRKPKISNAKKSDSLIEKIVIKGASENNLKNIDVEIPLGVFVAITGVSGSGKSTLIDEVLYKGLAKKLLPLFTDQPGKHKEITGLDYIDKVIEIDQSPIGRTPRSNPATYTGLFGPLRELFAQTQEAKARGYQAGRFSFNVKGGRCEACEGGGVNVIEMHFLSDVYVPCEVCKGKRYNRETLEVRYKGFNIHEVLEMTVDEAAGIFANHTSIMSKLEVLKEVGLGYIHLGQAATTLSGGEAQRIKLATELSKRSTGRTLYLLDEPTTGLHFQDVRLLLKVLNKLADSGNTVLVIEHNLDVIKVADHIIDLGPEGGAGGGRIVAQGTPEQVAKVKESYTGQFLKKVL
jgi:excinuclease ABC subunit A